MTFFRNIDPLIYVTCSNRSFFDTWNDWNTLLQEIMVALFNLFRWFNIFSKRANTNRMASYVTPIEYPEAERWRQQAPNGNQSLAQFYQYHDRIVGYPGFFIGSDFQLRIVDKGNNQKQLETFVEMKNFRPEEIKVSVENNELIVQGEHRHEDANRSEPSYFFKSIILPLGTQTDHLQYHLTDDGQLKIEAPFVGHI
ncbi:unnamed protein product [Adineta steineri]|uniref:SHSP domain-containing protein n=1 Tax=Adineta steineri TaxID=433720 RepID=A0A815PMZ6_9BILA|nr:unnamed protein product [Adineta steineri]CAF1450955.1 unnamed protein product [Adineta steineri]CAF3989677.1 unnamed protein product [Adineta steineri]CAF4072216.1 unnamed protein product [Adineta steineri]